MAKWGPGQSGNPAGRPPGPAGQYRREVARAKTAMGTQLVAVTEALIDAARGACHMKVRDHAGAWVDVTTKAQLDAALAAGERAYRIYTRDPDIRAAAVVMDRVMGKVPQPVDVEFRRAVEEAVAAQALLARVLQEHVPEEYLEPVLAELRRIGGRRARATPG